MGRGSIEAGSCGTHDIIVPPKRALTMPRPIPQGAKATGMGSPVRPNTTPRGLFWPFWEPTPLAQATLG